MFSLSKMAAVKYFPSIHNKTDNKKTWPFFDPAPNQKNSLPIGSRNDCSANNLNDGADQQLEAPAAWKTSNILPVPDYQPLDVFSAAEEDPTVASWSEADDICELCIRLKEIELCNMIGETTSNQESECDSNYL